jgi:hypothetical protein
VEDREIPQNVKWHGDGTENTPFKIHHLEYTIWNTPFGIHHLEYTIWNTPFGIPRWKYPTLAAVGNTLLYVFVCFADA